MDEEYNRTDENGRGNPEQTRQFWRHIYGTEAGFVCLASANRNDNELTGLRHTFYQYPSQAKAAAAHALKDSERGREVYYTAHLLKERTKRKKGNATRIRSLWADFDGASVPENPKPTAVVESSPGRWHCYWRLTKSIDPDWAEDLNKRLTYAHGGDKGKWVRTTLLRPPQTTNYKRDEPFRVALSNLDARREYDPDELNRLLPPLESDNEHTEASYASDEPPVRLGPSDLRVWQGDQAVYKDTGELDRSSSLFKIGSVLAKAGASRRAIVEALKERDESLGWNKYAGRADGPMQYANIAEKVTPKEKSSDAPDDESERPTNPLLAGRVDLGKAITQGIDPPDELEPDLLLDGKIHHFFGPSESGKTIVALWMAKCRVEARQHVVVFDAENGARTTAERLKQMDADPDLVGEYLVYLPFPDLTLGERGRQDFYNLLDEIKPALIVFDSWASFLSSAGFSENDNAEIEHWDNALTKRAKQRGIASAILDHVPHDLDRSRGGARKKEVADVQWQVKKTQDFDRDGVGEVLLIKHKDREGWLPPTIKFSIGGRYGELVCERSAGTIEEPGVADGLTRNERTVIDTLRDAFALTGARQSEWQKATDARGVARATHYRAVKKLVSTAVSPAHRVRLVDETYFPPDDTDPTRDCDTTGHGEDTPDSSRYHVVSNGSHDTGETSAETDGITGPTPLMGGPVIPPADTDYADTARDEDPIRELLADPPPWLDKQLAKARTDPDRFVKPTCAAVATEVFGSAQRWREALPALEDAIAL